MAYKVEGSGSAFEQKDVSRTKYRQITFQTAPEISTRRETPVLPHRSYRENNRYALSRERNMRPAVEERPALAIPQNEVAPHDPQAPKTETAQPAPEPSQVSTPPASEPVPATAADTSKVVEFAMGQQGKPYRYGSEGPTSFDCSGFTKYCYGQVGVSLPHNSRAQSATGTPVSREELRPGDLVFFGRSGVNHAGLYIGNGNFIHSPSPGETVRVQPLSSHPGYMGARRVQ